MNCCHNPQCLGIEKIFNEDWARRELEGYRKDGPSKTTRILLDALQQQGVEGATLLDIGGGIGAIQHALLKAGVTRAVSVDASPAYLEISRREAERLGLAERITFLGGDFVSLAPQIEPADIVTLDRVICCFDDMPALVRLSAARARRLYGVIYPRDTWWIKGGIALFNAAQWLLRNPFRVFAHPTREIDEIVRGQGFERVFYHRGLFWQVFVYRK